MEKRKPIKTFQDLNVYQNLYKAMLVVLKDLIVSLPKEERFDLVDQMRRACKAPPALLAEGFAKRYQIKQWQKYLRDAKGECYEMINHLSVCKDVYGRYVDTELCVKLIDKYDHASAQLENLSKAWTNFRKDS